MYCVKQVSAFWFALCLAAAGWIGQAYAGQTTRVSVNTSGNQGNGDSSRYSSPSISSDGRFVAFHSLASNLVIGDSNWDHDVFVHDRQTGQTTRVSVDSIGNQANGPSGYASISADGRFVAFESGASNLVAGDTNATWDVFVYDRQTGETTRMSVDSSGNQGNSDSGHTSISANGRYVAFDSAANNLVAGDTNNFSDVFVHDRQTGQTTRVSMDSLGNQGNLDAFHASISADGRYVAFESAASNLVAGDTNNFLDVFVHDRNTGQTTRVSVDSAGNQGDAWSDKPSINQDGRYVTFHSNAGNFVPGDEWNATVDVFVHDRQTGQTTLVSVDSAGNQGNGWSGNASISADGRYVSFESAASNLVAGDTDGTSDIFVHDRRTGQTTRVSTHNSGNQANGSNSYTTINGDGRYVAFVSAATNLVDGDTNRVYDVFIHETTSSLYRIEFDNDGYDDIAVWRPDSGIWFVLPSGSPGDYWTTQWGLSTDILVPGDYDGDGKTDISVYRPNTGFWYVRPSNSSGTYANTQWGMNTDKPVPGDYDGDGKTDIAVWRPETGIWYVLPSASPGTYTAIQWGLDTDIPVASDYDGDGKTDIAVWRPSTGIWYLLPSNSPGTYTGTQWGMNTDIPIPGNYDGDEKTDIAVWRPETGTWYVLPSASPGTYSAFQWGLNTDIPVASDYDGDGKTDIAVWRPSTGIWYVLPSNAPGTYTSRQWGIEGDLPISAVMGIVHTHP
jgi:hypothetical protein